ncbi:MAG: RNA methyltransferase [Anaerolineales bacterium]|nr:RNA methyltransferase [Anaerolineales bacterium]
MITSSKNPLIKQIRRLRGSKRHREREGLFVVEGIQAVVAAVRSDVVVDALIYAPALLESEIAAQAIEEARQSGVRVEAVDDAIFVALSARDNPMGIAALVERRLAALDAMPRPRDALYVALEGISDPGNLGTIIRTADAAGATGLLLVGDHVDPFHPSVVKASAGTLFTLRIASVASLDALFAWTEAGSLPVLATSDRAANSYWSHPYRLPMLVLMGAEGQGLSAAAMGRATECVGIPMSGVADSLNLAIATALLLYEVRRQQQERGEDGR